MIEMRIAYKSTAFSVMIGRGYPKHGQLAWFSLVKEQLNADGLVEYATIVI